MDLIYEEPKKYTTLEVNTTIKSGDEKKINSMLIGLVFNSSDFDYVYHVLSSLYSSKSTFVIATIFECLGHLARIHKHLPREVLDFYYQYKEHNNLDIQCRLDCFVDDLETYIPELYMKIKSNIQ